MSNPRQKQSDFTLDFKRLLAFCRAQLPAMLRCLEKSVVIESPSMAKAHVDRMAGFFAREFERLGGRVRLLPHATAGSAVLAEFLSPSGRERRPILLLGHLDTVWSVGTLRHMPFRIARGRAYGPGVFDMKSGVVLALAALRALRSLGLHPRSPIRIFLNPDEEVSSIALRRELLNEARRARAVLVLEPAAAGGALKTARKGVGEFHLTVYGRATHAGINPRAGVNAVTELARQLLRIETFQDFRRGLTLNAGVIEGGTRSNVVPEHASATVDVRIPRLKDRAMIERKIHSLKPFHPGARLEVTGGINRPPLERAMARGLFHHARRLAKRLGMDLQEASTGGGSDGNFTAALGVPTLDGLGGVGDGAHARHEHIVIRELPRRAALLAALLATL